jgi:hypothetical protein
MYSNNGSYENVQRGHYLIDGVNMYFRSKWEANYALYLNFLVRNKKIEKWYYEKDTFVFDKIKFGVRKYLPDFKIHNLCGTVEYHEVKGYFDSRSKTKIKRMKRYYPKVKLIVIGKDEYTLIKKQVGKLCGFYA